jgi:hypothetical protein
MIPILKRKRATRWQAIMAAGLLLAASAPRAELAGRFFFAPQERATLDALRHNVVAPGIRPASGPITVNGLVTNSSTGKSTVWINGIPQGGHESTSGITVIGEQPAGGKITVHLPGSSKPVGMRVGQTLKTGSGQVREVYEAKPRQVEDGRANQ